MYIYMHTHLGARRRAALARSLLLARGLGMLASSDPRTLRAAAAVIIVAVATYLAAKVAAAASSELPPPGTLSSDDVCENNDCMREFDGCWFYGIEDQCKDDVQRLVGFERQRSACFNAVFFQCVEAFNHRKRGRRL